MYDFSGKWHKNCMHFIMERDLITKKEIVVNSKTIQSVCDTTSN